MAMARMTNDVFILGAGESINRLTEEEKDYINHAPVRLAINKFAAFYVKAGVIPTHVYYVDTHENSSIFLQYMFDVCISDRLKNITFILSRKLRNRITCNYIKYLVCKQIIKLPRFKWKLIMRAPSGCQYEFIKHADWLEGGEWATDLEDVLFHYRGSLTTAMNYVSIKFPARRIKLVGVDFNSQGYFFQDEIDQLDLDWHDWTTPIVKERKMHMSAIEHEGTTMFDKFDDVISNLSGTGNNLVCCNSNSLLVEKAFVKYAPVMS